MIIGTVTEIKDHEFRVGLTPAGCHVLKEAGHTVLVEKGAGEGSGFTDEEYKAVGVQLLDKKEVFDKTDMIVKVKEPLAPEYNMFHENQILFTYLHLAPEIELTEALLKNKVVGIAFETVRGTNNSLPLLSPMSRVAGRMSVQIGAQYLERQYGGKGMVLGGVPGVEPGQVVIIGGGTVGLNAAKMAVGLGAKVAVLDMNPERLSYIDDIFNGRVETVVSNSFEIARWTKKADLLISCVLIPGAMTPKLVKAYMVKEMSKGSVIIDVAIDQGGGVETIDHVTTHTDPIYIKYGIVHYAVANIPGAVPKTSTIALANSTLPYVLKIANKGWKQALKDDVGLAQGLNTVNGRITFKAVADALNKPFTKLEEVLK
ncbi:alanine dehydrogenase [Megasphaera paucivorans]|uniref:Alanine dehydrogenase n=1 Tax=Megasphaera paucivorans TaxID=349095 RepID=A0A1H0AN03_9FIRM|nr:alanine dehydrogenase [Megasphaera paucivorans]SDN34256.1 alanine dehydrogenase [Megasphaera paucivorans]